MNDNNKCYGCHQDLLGEYCTLKKGKSVVEHVHFKCWEANQEQYKQEFDQITEKGKAIQTKCEESSCGKKFDPRTAESLRHKCEDNPIDYPDYVGLEITFANDLGSVYRLTFKEHEELNKNSVPIKTMEDLVQLWMKNEGLQKIYYEVGDFKAQGFDGKIKEDYRLMKCLAFFNKVKSWLKSQPNKEFANKGGDNPNPERERERERESILNYFKQNSIKSITLQGDKLLIEYNNNSPTETKPINTSELQQIQSYCQALGKNSLSLSDLQKSNPNTEKPTNYLPWIIGGGIILVLGIVIAYFLFRKKKE